MQADLSARSTSHSLRSWIVERQCGALPTASQRRASQVIAINAKPARSAQPTCGGHGNTFEYAGDALTEPLAHLWVDGPSCRDYDLTRTSALIRSALEDFTPWARYAAIQDFLARLEVINQASSPFETNDCAFAGPDPNGERRAHDALQCSGRLMLLFPAEVLAHRRRNDGLREDPRGRGQAVEKYDCYASLSRLQRAPRDLRERDDCACRRRGQRSRTDSPCGARPRPAGRSRRDRPSAVLKPRDWRSAR